MKNFKDLFEASPGTLGIRAAKSDDAERMAEVGKLSDARLKFHVVKNVPHGSYNMSYLKAEHNRRKKAVPNYASVKPSLNEETVEEQITYQMKGFTLSSGRPQSKEELAKHQAKWDAENKKKVNEEVEDLDENYSTKKTGIQATVAHPDGKPVHDILHKGEVIGTIKPHSAYNDTKKRGARIVSSRKNVTKYSFNFHKDKGPQSHTMGHYTTSGHSTPAAALEWAAREHAKWAEKNIKEAVTVNHSKHVVTVQDGNNQSFPLHAHHVKQIRDLAHGETGHFTDETRNRITATRDGDKVSLKGQRSNKAVHIHRDSLIKEETLDEARSFTMGKNDKVIGSFKASKGAKLVARKKGKWHDIYVHNTHDNTGQVIQTGVNGSHIEKSLSADHHQSKFKRAGGVDYHHDVLKSLAEEVEDLNEISDTTKRSWLDKAVGKSYDEWNALAVDADPAWKAKWMTPTGKIKKAWWETPEYKKLDAKRNIRRDTIQKTSVAVTGKPHYSTNWNGGGETGNAMDWHKGKKYTKEETVDELFNEFLDEELKYSNDSVSTELFELIANAQELYDLLDEENDLDVELYIGDSIRACNASLRSYVANLTADEYDDEEANVPTSTGYAASY